MTAVPGKRQTASLAVLLWTLAALSTPPAEASLGWAVSGVSEWPSQAHHDAAVVAIQAVTDRYNAYGYFGDYSVWVYYNAGIPTAQASCAGSIGFGGTWPAERVMQHELAHYLCLPSTGWLISGGVWQGPIADQLVRQFDGEQAELHGDSIHFWPYGLNYDTEGSEINKQRQVAMVYAMRADMDIGPSDHPSTATTVAAVGHDPAGESGFNYKSRWSDNYFPHAGANYRTSNFVVRTPATANSYHFYGDSLMVNNTNGEDGGLYYTGTGSSAVTSFDNLFLAGGWIQHRSGVGDLFQLDGGVNVVSDSTLCAKQGNIDILGPVTGTSTLTIAPTDLPAQDDRYVTFLSPDNTFTGDLVNLSRFELADGANFKFVIGASGVNNTITGAAARKTVLTGTLEIDVSGATTNPTDAWLLIDAANVSYGRRFTVLDFEKRAGRWTNGDYHFDPATGWLTPVTAWQTDSGGLWSAAGNWTGGLPITGEDAILGPLPDGPFVIDLDVPVILNRLTFDNANSYTLTGAHPLQLTGSADLRVKRGDHVIATPVIGTVGFVKSGSGSLTLSAPSLYSGMTRIMGGTLALTGAASISSSAIIAVSPGATLDVSGLASPFELAAGQTLHSDSNTTVAGAVIATAGSTLAGGGTFTSDVTIQDSARLQIGDDGLPVSSAVVPLDDFEAYPTGLVRDVASQPWTAHMNTMYAAIEDDGSGANNTLAFGWADDFRGASRALAAEAAIDNGDVATVFFRWYCQTDSPNHNLGLGDQADTDDVIFGDFEVQVRLYADNNPSAGTYGLDARSGGAFVDLVDSLATHTWYNVWLVIDQITDTYDVFLNTGVADAAATDKLNAAPLTFRNGTTDPLDTFLALAGASPLTNAVRIDDLHRAPGVNTANPLGPTDGLVFHPQDLAIGGDVILETGATVAFDIATAGVSDHLDIVGAFTAAGTLDLQLDSLAPVPQSGDTFDLIDAASVSGAFDAIASNAALAPGDLWDARQLYHTGEIGVVAAGDLLADSLACLAGPDTLATGPCVAQDLDGDTDHDIRDFATLQACATNPGGVLAGGCLGP
jgi:autotransporter-associated beta strand protein